MTRIGHETKKKRRTKERRWGQGEEIDKGEGSYERTIQLPAWIGIAARIPEAPLVID